MQEALTHAQKSRKLDADIFEVNISFDTYSQAYDGDRHIDDNYDYADCDNHNDDHDLRSAKTCRDFLSTLLAGSVLDSLSESARAVTCHT